MKLRNDARDFLNPDEIGSLTRRSDARGALAVAEVWLTTAAALAAGILLPHPVTILLVVVYLGGRQLAFAVLMHDATHNALFKSRRANDFFGHWLAAGPSFQHLHLYRRHHLGHHLHTGTDKDPDLRLANGFPVTRASMRRKLLRDALGVTGYRNLIGTLLMLAGWARYDVSGNFQKADVSGMTRRQLVSRAVWGLAPVVACNAALFGMLWAVGAGWAYLLWLGAFLTSYQVAIRIRSVAEHSMTGDPGDALNLARTTHARWWERALYAPLNVNYHIEHHMLPAVPFHRLPEMHRLLKARGAFDDSRACLAAGYLEVMKRASERPA